MDPHLHQTQGISAEGCAYCTILHPDEPGCPRCGRRVAFHPARMIDEAGVRRLVTEAAGAFDAQPSRASLDHLLRVLFVYGPLSLRILDERGRPTLDELRAADARLEPPPPPTT